MAVTYAAPVTTHQRTLKQAAAALRSSAERNSFADLRQCLDLLKQSSESVARDPEPYRWRARLLHEWAELAAQARRPDECRRLIDAALAAIDEAHAAGLDDLQLLRSRARVQQRAGLILNDPARRGDAVAAWRKIAQRNPYGLQDHMELADLLWTEGRRDEAREVYKRCLALSADAYLDEAKQLQTGDMETIGRRLEQSGPVTP
jgi:tetratricopeptide (TPR) repeat protein